MSWEIEIPIIVRTLIDDLSNTPTYSDERLKQAICVAAKYVQFDVSLDQVYSVDLSAPNIDPDPTDNRDEIFICLTALKTACIFDQSSIRTKSALEGVRASLGPASLSVSNSLEGLKLILEKGSCATYDELTSHWDVKEASAVAAILSPFRGNQFDPEYQRSMNYGYRDNFYS